jgi:hypothetical protein
MSVQQKQYLIIGIILPYSYFDNMTEDVYEFLEEYMISNYDKTINHKNGLACLFDGMSGKYIILGRIIQSGKNCLSEYCINYSNLTEIQSNNQIIFQEVEHSLLDVFNISVKPELLLVTHYS